MIWHRNPLTPISTLMVVCCSTVGDPEMGFPICTDPERILTANVLRALLVKMEQAGIEKIDGFYHGFIHPFPGYDLFSEITDVDIIKAGRKIGPPEVNAFEYAGVRFLRTNSVNSLILMGKHSSPVNAVDVWLLNEKDIPLSA